MLPSSEFQFTFRSITTFVATLYSACIRKHPMPIIPDSEVEASRALDEEKPPSSAVFEMVTLCDGCFLGANKVNCAAPFGSGRRVVYGTDDGIYLSDLREPNRDPAKVLALLHVSQVDVLENYQLLIVLSEHQVITFPLDALDPLDPMAGLERAKRISSHTAFFKVGICLGKVLLCIVKTSPQSSTIKTLEPIDPNTRGRSKPPFQRLLPGWNDTLQLFREFYLPVELSSVHFLKTKLCVGCSTGFEIVDLESLETQALLDSADASLDFVKKRKRKNHHPMAIYGIHDDFLVCYDEFAFYVDKNGCRSRQDFMVHWKGSPTGFALRYPFVLAFEPTFVEIRHVETGLVSQVIQGNNLRLLFSDTMHGYGPQLQKESPQHPLHAPAGRDEILMVSDGRVLTLRPAAGNSHVLSDTTSLASESSR
ncbi:CNH-domain-containing protein [Leucogyrophana mollusca]|uniref:CNH-domain-containing protein n=1 Tax=Leucogyrophana mollusca TaxID=85980 RepID=A0ACB8BG77_9AGAM|nr:CNH-domain-containing protein [Leucogyrophana mollusca]